MFSRSGATKPRQVRLRINEQRQLLIPSYLPRTAAPQPDPPAVELPFGQEPGETTGAASCVLALKDKPVVALIEVSLAGAEGLAHSVMEVLEAAGYRAGAISLDGQNRLGTRLGCSSRSPVRCWKQASPELLISQGRHTVVPGPVEESDLVTADIEAVLQKLIDVTDGLVVTLGARWQPRLFRPVLARATHIWLVAPAGMWSGVETRMEQAEFSGWTDVDRIRLVVIGQGGSVPEDLGVPVAAVLPGTEGQSVREFALQEIRRGMA